MSPPSAALKDMFTCIQECFDLLELHRSEPQDVLTIEMKYDELCGNLTRADRVSSWYDRGQVATFMKYRDMVADVKKLLSKEYRKRAFTLKVHGSMKYVTMLS